MPQERSRVAFDVFREGRRVQPMNPDAARYEGDADLMTAEDGRSSWEDGAATAGQTRTEVPVLELEPAGRNLWVVVAEDVFYALEACPFGAARGAKLVKHSNLTAGGDAFAGGELVFLDDHTVVLNGCSGRYRIQSEADMRAVASAFRRSGYRVWSMGWNDDVDRPAMFGTQDPEWVAA